MRAFTKIKFMFRLLPAFLFLGSITLPAQHKGDVEVWKIWDGSPHSAFTDLLFFKGNYYCSFREGSGHVPGTDGTVRILKSPDGKRWESIADLKKEGIDLRDPKLSVTPAGKIMVIMGGSIYNNGKLEGRKPQVSFSDANGGNYSAPEEVRVDPAITSWGDWLWRVTWHNGVGYTIDYQIGPQERKGPTAMYLLKTTDGKYFEKVSKIEMDGFPNEATIRFDKKGVMHVLIRRELEDQMGVLAESKAPFTNWTFHKLDQRLGGPNFVFTEKGKILMGTRVHEGSVVYTGLFLGDTKGNFHKVATFPSSGDTSYPGMVIRNGSLWFSYYSSHEGKTSIYMASLPLKALEKK
ncbi:sialidase family protein [Ravibacter arvi]|uniref:Sialidase family protein n=1 Tax=Ravibacter arvi TaxID=2051041 RepID=A0ABP8MDM3_9BACT